MTLGFAGRDKQASFSKQRRLTWVSGVALLGFVRGGLYVNPVATVVTRVILLLLGVLGVLILGQVRERLKQ